MSEKIGIKTGDLFYSLWKNLNKKQSQNDINLIINRLKINNFPTSKFKNKIIVDVGCGSGRFCKLAHLLKAKKVIGIDSSKKNINYNKKKYRKISNLKFIYGDNTKLKLKNNLSDITISQGVIHHTTDMFKSLSELIRITKKGGIILLLVYGEHGMLWNLIKKLRPICKLVGKKEIIKIMKQINLPENNIKHFIDNLFVPIQIQTSHSHLAEYLREKKLKFKVWNKYKTFDHEQSVDDYLQEFYKLKNIFYKLKNPTLKTLSIRIIKSYLNEIKIIRKSKLDIKKQRYLIIGEGNHRFEIRK